MKAIVKATGDIIEISEDCSYLYAEHYNKSYNLNELEILDVKENAFPYEDPDYWTRLEHTYAGMAIQGLMSYIKQITPENGCSYCDAIVDFSVKVAHALVEKLKEKEERK